MKKKMKKFEFLYFYEYSSLRYKKIIEAETRYKALNEFDRWRSGDESICVYDINEIKNE